MFWKIRYDIAGGHVHCSLFCAKGRHMTYAKCGDFVVRQEELDSLMRAFSAEFVEREIASKEAGK